MGPTSRIAMGVLVVLSWIAGANAMAEESEAPQPWAVGVSQDEQAAALLLYEQGNAEFEEQRYTQALAKYREAVVHWDHPAIRFNLAVCLINLGQVLEAYDNIELALKYGAAPLVPAEKYQEGLTYQKLLIGQIGTLKVVCKEPGAEVTLDGKILFTAPGAGVQRLTPGNHHVVATKAGFLTATIPVLLLPGKETVEEVRLVALEAVTTMVRRWKPWKPWAVVAAGALLAGMGVLAELHAAEEIDRYDREYGERCPKGCTADDPRATEIRSMLTHAHLEEVVAVSLMALGGAGMTSGLVGVFLNRPRPVVEQTGLAVRSAPGHGAPSLVLRWNF